MFDAGFAELVLLMVIGLLILGPERLPRVASQLGRWVARARRTAMQLRQQLDREIALSEIAKSQPKKPKPKPQAQPPAGEGAADVAGEPDAAGDAPPRADGEADAGGSAPPGTQAASSTEAGGDAGERASASEPSAADRSPSA